jgi:DNA mismatch endonuclease (patch repair protein)
MPGKPDIILPKYKTVIFVHGCFWHGHLGCRHSDLPKSNREYWIKKIERNINRDINNITLLEMTGWKVITIWECDLNKKKHLDEFLQKIVYIIKHK